MNIGVDLDGVLLDVYSPLLEFHNENYNTNHDFNDVESYYLWNLWNCSKEEAHSRVEEFFETERFNKIQPGQDAKKAVRELSNVHDLHVVTSRVRKIREPTLDWIREHFQNVFEDVHFTHDPVSTEEKAKVCLDNNISVLVEDKVDSALNCASNGIRVYLMSQPWNKKDKLPDNVMRVSDWREVLNSLRHVKIKVDGKARNLEE